MFLTCTVPIIYPGGQSAAVSAGGEWILLIPPPVPVSFFMQNHPGGGAPGVGRGQANIGSLGSGAFAWLHTPGMFVSL